MKREEREISSERKPIYDTAALPPPFFLEFQELFRYKDLVVQLVRRDVITRYKRTVLGVAWTMLHPLAYMVVISLVFSYLFQTKRVFPVYFLAGFLAWQLFAQGSTHAMRQIVWGGSLFHRIYVPKTLFAVSAVGTGIVNFLLSLVPLGLILIWFRVPIGLPALLLPFALFVLVLFTLGVALLCSTFSTRFPDFVDMYEIALQGWFFLTPLMYPVEILPPWLQNYLPWVNPMVSIVELFRCCFYYNRFPTLLEWVYPLSVSFMVCFVGWSVFTYFSRDLTTRV